MSASSSNVERFRRLVLDGPVELDLGEAAVLVATTAYPDLDVGAQIARLDALAARAPAAARDASRPPATRVAALARFLHEDVGLRGNVAAYHDPRNSYLNDVLDRGLGIPITLSVVMLEVARRVSLPLVGIGFPGHFLVRHASAAGLYVDPFRGGVQLGRGDLVALLRKLSGRRLALRPEHLRPVPPRQIVLRMLNNLRAAHVRARDLERLRAVLDRMRLVAPDLLPVRLQRSHVLVELDAQRDAVWELRTARLLLDPGTEGDRERERIRTALVRLARRRPDA